VATSIAAILFVAMPIGGAGSIVVELKVPPGAGVWTCRSPMAATRPAPTEAVVAPWECGQR
jgi:hypothetical protein